VRPKDQGTRWETAIVDAAKAHGCDAWRLAPAGARDVGDVVVRTPDGDHYIVQAKDRQALNIHECLGELLGRVSERPDEPFAVTGVGVAWKRMLKLRDGELRRRRAGPPVVAVSLEEWLELITR